MVIIQIITYILLTINIFVHGLNSFTIPKIKISKQPFLAYNIEQLKEINWTMIGKTASETIYCVSDVPEIQLQFVCPECNKKNLTDIINALTSTEDLTEISGFPTIVLQNVPAKANWTGISIICQGKLNDKIFQSSPAKIVIQYIRQPFIVNIDNMKPNLTFNQGYNFYIDCLKSYDGKCQEFSNKRNKFKCLVDAYPEPTIFKWYKNGIEIAENESVIEIDVNMIGQSIQCGSNNGLHRENNMLQSQAIQVYPLIAPKIIQNNFKDLGKSKLYQPGNRINMKESIILNCDIEGNPKPKIVWKHRKINGEIVDASCLKENSNNENVININNAVRVRSSCKIYASNYSSSGKYWCTGCLNVSKNSLECYSNYIETLNRSFEMNIQGPPMVSMPHTTLEMINKNNDANIKINYCSNPKPLLKKEVTIVIDKESIHEGESWKNLKFIKIEDSNMISNCFSANLIIKSFKTFDKTKKISLIVQNTFGKIDINIPIDFNFNENNFANIYPLIINGAIIFLVLLVISLAILIRIKYYILKMKKIKDVEENKLKNNEDRNQIKKETDNFSKDTKDQGCIETNINDSLNLPMIDDALVYNDYVDFKIYGTLKKQSVYFSQEAFV
uniref:Ig-like domain-containing protein n=1 Tax=Strongyloides stercoralis TaxID=6248 RepID=A0A0K0ERP8_STRER